MGKNKNSQKITYVYFSFVCSLFVFICKTGRDLSQNGNILWTGTYTLITLILSVGIGVVAGILLSKGLIAIEQKKKCETGEREEKEHRFPFVSRHIFAFSFLLTLLAWLPAYLAYYPGICAYDFTIQMEQILSYSYIDHHPIAHTLLLQFYLWVGEHLLGDINVGAALLTATQMILLAAVYAYGVRLLKLLRVNVFLIGIVQLWLCIYPFHWYMSLSITKDTIFTSFFLLAVFGMLQMLLTAKEKKEERSAGILTAIACAGVVLFRNNGRYALMVLLVVILFVIWKDKERRNKWMRLGAFVLSGFVLGVLLVSGIFRVTSAEQGDRREMLSVPIQQWARCMVYHGDTMDADAKDMIQSFILNEAYEYYQPNFADPVKRHVNTSATLRQPKRFVTTYLKLFLQYPGDYLNAVLALDAGFIYPFDEAHATINQAEGIFGNGYVQTRWVDDYLNPLGIHKASKWEWLYTNMENWANENAYLKLPVLKYLFMPGGVIWVYLFLLGIWIVQKRPVYPVVLCLVLSYFATMLLGPTVQLRYLYPIMAALPYFACLTPNRLEKF